MRTLSSADIQAQNSSETGEAYLCLITISHPNLPLPITITSDIKTTVSNGVAFVPVPFLFQIPDDRSDQLPVGKLQLDNIDLSIITAIRAIGNVPATVLMQIVLLSNTNPANYMGAYNSGTTYAAGNTVTFGGESWVSVVNGNVGVTPGSNGAYWQSTVEAQWEMTLRNVTWDDMTITADLRFDEILDEPYPGDLVTPSTMPGVFEIEE